MKLFQLAIVPLASSIKTQISSAPVMVTKFQGPACSSDATTDIWTINPVSTNDLTVCTLASHTTPTLATTTVAAGGVSPSSNQGVSSLPSGFDTFGGAPGLPSLIQTSHEFQALHLTCHSGSYALGSYTATGGAIASCSNVVSRETFPVSESYNLASGNCANSAEGNSYRLTLSGLQLPDCSAGVVGDPHLTNLHGEKFDIHDGMHRLVHFPRGAPEKEALFMVDAKAVDMGSTADCYSVYLESVKLSGKWVGDEINIGASTNSVATSDPSAFFMSFANERLDFPTLATQHDTPLQLKGSMPVTVATSLRNASGEDAMGGEEMTFKVGEQRPVLVQVWSSKAHNSLTHDKEVRYLNVQVKNLPKNVGGIIGLDSYARPSSSHCELVQEERDLLDYAQTDTVNLLRQNTPQWSASATVQEQ